MNSRILPSIALMIAIGIFFGYVNPTWKGSIAEIKSAIESDKQALAAADDYIAKQNALASARNAIEPDNLARLSVFLPDSVDNVGLILDINALAARSGLSLSNIDVVTNESDRSDNSNRSIGIGGLQSSKLNPVGSVDLSLSAVGTYSSLQAFLIGLENSARLLDVNDLVVKGSETGVYSYKMTVRLYWLR
jgi:Tfp pilus assembly protein PilO